MHFIQILYRSIARQPHEQREILDILRKSQSNNQRKQISGLLIFRDGQYLQFLEGPDVAVNALFEVISQDPRHHDIEIIDQLNVESMVMPTWAMGYFSPELDPTATQDSFLLKEASARAICELLPERLGKHFLELLNQETPAQ